MGIVMLIGQVILMGMWNANWFKRENFKIQKSNVLAENRLNLRKLEKDLGLGSSKKELLPTESPPTDKLGLLSQLAPLAPILAKLDSDQIGALIDKFVTGAESEEGGGGLLESIPPELIESFLKGFKENKGSGDGGVSSEDFTPQV